MVRSSLVRCTCISYNCCRSPLGYTELPRPTQQRHRENDLELSFRQLAMKEVELAAQSDDSGSHVPTSTESSGGLAGDGRAHNSVTAFEFILAEYQSRLRSFSQLAENLEHQPESIPWRVDEDFVALQGHISWMTSTMCNLRAVPVGSSENDNERRLMLAQILQEKLGEIKSWEEARYDLAKPDWKNERNYSTPMNSEEGIFQNSLPSCHPLALLSMFITIVLNAVHELPERSSNFLLQMLSDLLKLASNSWNSNEGSATLMKQLPRDIRTVRSRFGLEPQIQIFAACPKCSTLYEPKFDPLLGFDVYPVTNCNAKDLDETICGTAMLKWHVRGKQAVRVPSRPYGYCGLRSFVGEMLSRSGFEDLLERCPPSAQPDVLNDVFDGKVIRDFKDRDGKYCFRMNGDSDLYLAWALSVDWFNPYHNKIAGKSVSVGVVSMVCLNLPLGIRNDASNTYLVGIIPGPREPSLDKVNHFLAPLVNDFFTSWQGGLKYNRTCKYLDGRTVYCFLIPLVADLPASRKVSGTASHSSRCFCPLCLRKKEEINDFSVCFAKRTKEEHASLAKEWRDARTQSERKSLAKKNGIRDSILFKLPYWEPRFILVDTMHSIFLGLIQYHFRVVIGIDYEKSTKPMRSKRDGAGMTAKRIGKILEILLNPQGPIASRLKRFSIKELVDFHIHQKIPLSLNTGKHTKNNLILSLLSCKLVNNGHSMLPHGNTNESSRTHDIDKDALPFFSLSDTSFPVFAEAVVGNPGVAKKKVKARSHPGKPNVGPQDVQAIQSAIRATCRPSWQQGPPKAFGTSQQGKLKADQWRTLLEFDLPVSLVELWGNTDVSESTSGPNDHLLTLLDLTMELACAVFWGTSRRTSVDHATAYLYYLQNYLQGLQMLSPKPKLVPNHHAALHIGEQLLLFGPVNGWWAYPYERLIGTLQKLNTNHSIGEIELTILRSYHAAARLERLLDGNDCPAVLKSYAPTLEKHFSSRAFRPYSSSLSAINERFEGKSIQRLDDDIYEAVCSLTKSEERPNRKFSVHKSYIVDGFRFTSLESERDSIIFYGRGSDRFPCIIRKIFSMSNGVVLFAIHTYLPCDVYDPFVRWPDFRASLWSQRVDEQVKLINPENSYICHAARRAWKDGDTFVLRPLDRVRYCLMLRYLVYNPPELLTTKRTHRLLGTGATRLAAGAKLGMPSG